ncbi:hypothetical protein GF407_13415 [candidate division KSB1 bacterium]|nr:hypothetical protein [candidate division KSB1 bacterium]
MNKNQTQFFMGTSRIDVTPAVGTFLSGFGSRNKPSDGVYHPLSAVISFLSDGNTDVLLVSMEWLGFYDLTKPFRAALSTVTGIAPDRIFLMATHTHCGPALPRPVDIRRHDAIDDLYFDSVKTKLCKAAEKAMQSRKAVRLFFSQGWCGFAASRRKPDGRGGVEWKPTLDAPHDHRVPVIVAKTMRGKVFAVLFGYACHPTGAGDVNQIGGGYVGYAYDYLEKELGEAKAAFFQGGGGDQKPFVRNPESGDFRRLSLAEVEMLGHRLGLAVMRAIHSEDGFEIVHPLTVKQSMISIPSEQPDRQRLNKALQDSQPRVRNWARHNLDLLDCNKPLNLEHSLESQSLLFGRSLAFVALAGEITSELALNIQHRLEKRFDRVVIAGYANHIIGYITSSRQHREGGYEVVDFARNWLLSGSFDRNSEQKIIRMLLKDLQFT